MKHTIRVEQKHIDAGKQKHCRECPVALAFQDEGFTDATVTDNWVFATEDAPKKLPDTARHFIRNYDRGLPHSPFDFEIEV